MKQKKERFSPLFCTPAGARTLDTLIKSQVLYQLSYGCIIFTTSISTLPDLRVQRYGVFSKPPNILETFFAKKMKKGRKTWKFYW